MLVYTACLNKVTPALKYFIVDAKIPLDLGKQAILLRRNRFD